MQRFKELLRDQLQENNSERLACIRKDFEGVLSEQYYSLIANLLQSEELVIFIYALKKYVLEEQEYRLKNYNLFDVDFTHPEVLDRLKGEMIKKEAYDDFFSSLSSIVEAFQENKKQNNN